tara:strand:- start:39 stop:272 length:234 start_codon:yes stop_codon:yes gene_type:complete
MNNFTVHSMSSYTKVIKKVIDGVTYFAVVWKKTNKIVSIWKQIRVAYPPIKIGSFNSKNKKALKKFDEVSNYFENKV